MTVHADPREETRLLRDPATINRHRQTRHNRRGVREIDLLEQEENLGQAQLQVDRLRKDIAVEVQQALVASETLSTTLATLKKQVTLAERNYDLTAKQYQVGEATSLDVNNTLNILNLVRVRLTDQTYAYQLALLNLERVVGAFGQDYLSQR